MRCPEEKAAGATLISSLTFSRRHHREDEARLLKWKRRREVVSAPSGDVHRCLKERGGSDGGGLRPQAKKDFAFLVNLKQSERVLCAIPVDSTSSLL